MMNNKDFLEVIRRSFYTYLSVGTSRSTAKLKTLHGSIAEDVLSTGGEPGSLHFACSQDTFSDLCTGLSGFSVDKQARVYPRKHKLNVDSVHDRAGEFRKV